MRVFLTEVVPIAERMLEYMWLNSPDIYGMLQRLDVPLTFFPRAVSDPLPEGQPAMVCLARQENLLELLKQASQKKHLLFRQNIIYQPVFLAGDSLFYKANLLPAEQRVALATFLGKDAAGFIPTPMMVWE